MKLRRWAYWFTAIALLGFLMARPHVRTHAQHPVESGRDVTIAERNDNQAPRVQSAGGRTFYVGPGGSNANPGTHDAPWASPGYASRQLQPGDTLILLDGRYILSVYDDDILMPPSGAPDAWVTIKGEDGKRPVLAGRDNLYAAVIIEGRSYVRLENLEITHDDQASGSGIYFRTGIAGAGSPVSHLVLKDLYIHHIDEGAVDLQDVDDLLVINCRMEYCGSGGLAGPVAGPAGGWRNVRVQNCTLSWGGHYYQGGDGSDRPYDRPDGFGVEPSQGPIEIVDTLAEHNYGDGLDSKVANTTIRRCVVANNSCDGVKLWDGGCRVENTLIYGRGDGDAQTTPWSPVVIGTEHAGATFEIVNCTIDDALGHNYLLHVQYDTPSVPASLILRNNIWRGAAENSPLFVAGTTTLTVQNNLFYMPNTDHVLEHGATTYYAADISTLDSGNLYGDALFVAPAWGSTGDYHLLSGSPAINHGTTTAAPDDDLQGYARDALPDMGAYEYGSVPELGTTTPTAAPSQTPTPTPTTSPDVETTVFLQQGSGGYTGCDDTYIYQYATVNSCGDSTLKVGYRQQYAGLLRFDLSMIPAGAEITDARLELYATGWSGANITLGAYAILRSVVACQATWNQAAGGNPWALPGGNDTLLDRRATAEASLTTSGINRWYYLDLHSLVAEWAAGSLANNGVLLRAGYSNASLLLASAQNSTVANRPRLMVTYRAAGGATPTATQPASTSTATRTATWTATPSPTATRTATPGATCVIIQRGTSGTVADAYVWAAQPDYTGNWENLYTGIVGDGRKRSLLRFDLSGIPAAAVVDSASVQVYLYSGDGGHTVNVHRITLAWSETSVTWNNFVSGYAAAPVASFSTANGWRAADVTGLVQGWLNGGYANYGLLLDDPAASGSATYYASEYGEVAYRPKLEVCYHVGTPGSLTPTATRTLTASPTPTGTTTRTATPTRTASNTLTPVESATPTRTPTVTPTLPGGETTVTLQQGHDGYAGSGSTYLYQYAVGDNYCAQGMFKVGYKQQNAGLLRFDVSLFPPGAVVLGASLEIYAMSWGGANMSLGVYSLLRDAAPCQATWNQAQTDQAWALPGANDTSRDRRAVPESSLTTAGINRWYSFDMTSLVAGWVGDGLSNHGVLLRATSAGSTATFQFGGAANGNVELRPRLVVTYRGGSGVTPTPVVTNTATPSPTATRTGTLPAPSVTPTGTATPTSTPTRTSSPTPTRTLTPTPTATLPTPTPTLTRVPGGSDDPNPPQSPVKLIFIHHSTGTNWLSDSGGLGIALRDNNYFVSDTNYGWGPDVIGDSTDIGHWWNWFVGPSRDTYTDALYHEYDQDCSYSRLASDPGGENEIVIFKSCFPNSAIGGNPSDPPTAGSNPLRGNSSPLTVGNAKGIYNDLLTYFATRQNKLFIVVTAPPLVVGGDPAEAVNARAFNNWLLNDWLTGYPYNNVAVFDFYNVLTSNGGNANTNDTGWAAGNHHRWRNGAVEHSQTVSYNYAAYGVDGDSHPTAAGNQKASAEFVPLLNVYYHRWKGGGSITPTRTATPSPTPSITPSGGETSLMLQQGSNGYAGCADTYIYQYAPGSNYCTTSVLKVGYKQQYAGLLRFDLSAIPIDSTVTSATLQVYATGWSGASMGLGAYVVLREADSCALTWNQATAGNPWGLPGANDTSSDRLDVPESSTTATGVNRWISFDVTAALQAWAGGSRENNALLLRGASAYATALFQFASAEDGAVERRPVLRIIYHAP